MEEKIQEIVYSTRRTGNTSWILNAAIKSPNCIIVSRNMQQSKDLKRNYDKLLLKLWWGEKLWRKFLNKGYPKFYTLNNK